jgi:hypothetical protein
VHSEQHHTGRFIFEAICMFFWFNQLYGYKKAIIQNLEFIADKEALKKYNNKKSLSANPFKITTKKIVVANHFINH